MVSGVMFILFLGVFVEYSLMFQKLVAIKRPLLAVKWPLFLVFVKPYRFVLANTFY